jgi:quercetin dioxygenase-like cupin family protein
MPAFQVSKVTTVPPREIDNPRTGEWVRFLRTGAETQGDLLEFEMAVAPGGAVAGAHLHPKQSEGFRAVAGTLTLFLNGVRHEVAAGSELIVPPGTIHAFANEGSDTARVLVTVRPALQLEAFIRIFFGLSRDGLTDDRGFITVLRFAALYWRFRDSFVPAKPPKFVLDTILGLLYPISRLCGYPNAYAKYEGGVAA